MGTTFFLQLGGKSDGHGYDGTLSDEASKVSSKFNSKLVIIKNQGKQIPYQNGII